MCAVFSFGAYNLIGRSVCPGSLSQNDLFVLTWHWTPTNTQTAIEFFFSLRYDDSDAADVCASHIRPRARHRVSLEDVEIGSRVFINYNYDDPSSRGYWYDAIVTKKKNTRTMKELIVTVFIG